MLYMNLTSEGKLEITLEPQLRLQLASEFSKVVGKQFEPMQKWFDDKDVPQAEKDKYEESFITALAEMNFLYQVLKHCGMKDEEIKEWAEIPF